MKKTLPDGVVVYTYGETKTIHTTHPSGLSVIEFPNGQVEKHLPDGSQEIVFPDQTFKCRPQHFCQLCAGASAPVAGTSAPAARSRQSSATELSSRFSGTAAKRLSSPMDKRRLCALRVLAIPHSHEPFKSSPCASPRCARQVVDLLPADTPTAQRSALILTALCVFCASTAARDPRTPTARTGSKVRALCRPALPTLKCDADANGRIVEQSGYPGEGGVLIQH